MQATHAELKLNPGQVHLLMNLEPSTSAPMSELADALACDASYVTGIVDRLEARGVVHRVTSPDDRRVKRVALTEAGRALRDDLMTRVSRPPPFIEGLATKDKRALRDIFMRAWLLVQEPQAPATPSVPRPRR
jgi:DNA-binding MarR family transcriptional regulator